MLKQNNSEKSKFNLKYFITILNKNMKLSQLINSIPSINALMGKELPTATAYKLILLSKKINPEVESFEKSRKTLVERLGKQEVNEDGTLKVNESGQPLYSILEKDKEEFEKEFKSLIEQEVNIEYSKIKISELGDNIKAVDLINIDWLLEE
jgi:hypothetical protein